MRKEWRILAVGMVRCFEGEAGGAVQLADDDALGAVDDEGALRGHQGQFAHEDLFLLGGLFLLEEEGDMEGRAVGDAFAQAFEPVVLGFADFVVGESQDAFAIVAFDGEDLGEDGL